MSTQAANSHPIACFAVEHEEWLSGFSLFICASSSSVDDDDGMLCVWIGRERRGRERERGYARFVVVRPSCNDCFPANNSMHKVNVDKK